MTDSDIPAEPAPVPPPPPRLLPVALRPPAERRAHVAARMLTRGGLTYTPEQVAALEAKIEMVRGKCRLNQPVAPILPKKIGEDKVMQVQYWRVYFAGQPHTFAWSRIAKGLISYAGPGELKAGKDGPRLPAVASVIPVPVPTPILPP